MVGAGVVGLAVRVVGPGVVGLGAAHHAEVPNIVTLYENCPELAVARLESFGENTAELGWLEPVGKGYEVPPLRTPPARLKTDISFELLLAVTRKEPLGEYVTEAGEDEPEGKAYEMALLNIPLVTLKIVTSEEPVLAVAR